MTQLPPLPPELEERVFAAVQQQPAPTRNEVRSRRALGLAAAVSLALAWALRHGLPSPSGERSPAFLAAWLGLLLVSAIVATWHLLVTQRSLLGRSARHQLVWAITAVPLVSALLVLVRTLIPPEGAVTEGHHLPCLVSSCLLSAILLTLGLRIERGSAPAAPSARAASMGLVAGLWTAWAVSVGCPSGQLFHNLIVHVGPIVLAIFGAMVAGRRLLALTTWSAKR